MTGLNLPSCSVLSFFLCDPLRLCVFARFLLSLWGPQMAQGDLTQRRKGSPGYRPRPPPVRGAAPKPGADDWFAFGLLALDNVCPVTTSSPSTRLPSRTSVETPSVRPTLILRRSGCPFVLITQTIRVWPASTGAVAGANCESALPFASFPLPLRCLR